MEHEGVALDPSLPLIYCVTNFGISKSPPLLDYSYCIINLVNSSGNGDLFKTAVINFQS
jgi:hypothetical protein